MEFQWLTGSDVQLQLKIFKSGGSCVLFRSWRILQIPPKGKRAYTHTKYFILFEGVPGMCETDSLAPEDNPQFVLHVSASSGIVVPKVDFATLSPLFRCHHSHVNLHVSEDTYYSQKHEIQMPRMTHRANNWNEDVLLIRKKKLSYTRA